MVDALNKGKDVVRDLSHTWHKTIHSSQPLLLTSSVVQPIVDVDLGPHTMLVDRVFDALLNTQTEPIMDDHAVGDSSDEGDFSTEDDEADDAMTLVEYQNEVKKEALVRQGRGQGEATIKKGRVSSASFGS